MIITHIKHGLGNQMFQYAIGRSLAYRRNTELKLDITQTEAEKSLHHCYYQLGEFNIQENFATTEEINNPLLQRITDGSPVAGRFIPQIFEAPDNIHIKGVWQNEKYFVDIKDILWREFTLKNPLGEVSNSWREKILAAECAVSLHVRHGDYMMPPLRYVHGLIPQDYYFTCVKKLKENYPALTVFVFSDDLDWAKEKLDFGVQTEFVEGCEKASEELYLMSLCKHNIISNSSFSWWGSWLNQNPDKKVFAPEPWFRYLKDSGCTPVADDWIKIPVNYVKHAHDDVPVLLSLILYVENNADTIEIAASAAMTQTFKDYNIIIIDASTDGSGEFCRRFAGNDNVTIIKVNRSTGKFAAWNLGVDCARSEYVLFLNGKDFILPHAVSLCAKIWEWNFNRYSDNKIGAYTTAANYGKNSPNIICTTQMFEEDISGTLTIGGLPDKKFIARIDAPFQNLNAVAELKIESAQKLNLLATNQISNLLGTKFFKRDFLNENKIRFDEKLGADAELMFLVNAFMHTENIVFVPQVFYGRFN